MKNKYGPLSNAYEYGSLHYKLAYHAFNELDLVLANKTESEKLANELGVTEDEIHQALEDLYTNNADPDAANE